MPPLNEFGIQNTTAATPCVTRRFMPAKRVVLGGLKQPPARRGRRKVRRRAAVMAAALVCLLVVMLLGGTLVRAMLLDHRQAKTELRQLQALWLAESAAALAVEQLQADREYAGQTWRAAVGDRSHSIGIAEIEVLPVDQQPRQRIVRIRSTYPDDPVERIVIDNEITVTLPALGASE